MDKRHFMKKPKTVLVQDILYYRGTNASLGGEIDALRKELQRTSEKLNRVTCQRNAAVVAARSLLGLVDLT